jgi:serine protease Do
MLLCIIAPVGAQTDDAAALRARRRTPVVEVFEASKDSVVNIASKQIIAYRSPLGFDDLFERFFDNRLRRQPQQVERTSVGSGFVLHKSGLIVTNAHVVAQTAERKVIFDDNKEYDAQIVAIDHEHDLAVLKINVDHDIKPLPLGHSDDLMVGETVIAIGNALGYQHTVTSGVVSALNRSIDVDEKVAFKDLIQTDASINPGNSGGPLLNVLGELVGINTAIRADAQNIGFAIPVNDLRRLLPQMLAIESRSRLQFGMQVSDRNGKTLKVVRVDVDSPAYKSGIQVGDEVVQLDHQPVTNAVDYAIALVGKKANDVVELTVIRHGKHMTRKVQIIEKPKPNLDDQLSSLFGLKVGVITPQIAEEAHLGRIRGVFVIEVEDNSPAAKAGLRRGDIITSMGDLSTSDADTLAEQLESVAPGNRIRMIIYRIGQRSYIRTGVILTAR